MKLPRILVGPYVPLRRPSFPVSESLYERQLKAAAKCPTNGIRPLLIEDQPDTFLRPAAISEGEYYGPIG